MYCHEQIPFLGSCDEMHWRATNSNKTVHQHWQSIVMWCCSNCPSHVLMTGASLCTLCKSWGTTRQTKKSINWTCRPPAALAFPTWLLCRLTHCV